MGRQEIISVLLGAVAPKDRIVVLHSSLAHLRVSQTCKWDWLAGMRALLAQGHTLVLPTFTFSFCRQLRFRQDLPSETGQLGDWLLELPEARRSPHPIYSFAVDGPLTDEICSCPNSTTFGDDSTFALFERYDARLVMLGCDWHYCTQFHRYEEEAGVPYRHFKTFEGTVDDGGKQSPISARMFVRDMAIDPLNDFTVACDGLKAESRIHISPLLGGQVESVSCANLAFVCRKLLAKNPYAFVKEGPWVELAIKHSKAAAATKPLRIALLGHANLAMLQRAFHVQADLLMPDRRIESWIPPYGQLTQQILADRSDLAIFAPDFSIFADRPEEVLEIADILQYDDADALAAVAAYVDLIRRQAERSSGWIFVMGFAETGPSSLGAAAPPPGRTLIERMNQALTEGLEGLNQVVLIDIQPLAARAHGSASDPRLWYLGRFPWSAVLTAQLARKLAGMVLTAIGRTIRLLALDLDNTLWGGVLGEDGLEGIHLGGDYPGNAFAAFQKGILALTKRGIALAICSKNDEAHALDAIRRHPAMTLSEDRFAALRINWEPKWVNLREIAEELGLGLESVMLVDDNPVERESMHHHLPEVAILDLPDDPAGYLDVLLGDPRLECLTVTDEDRGRVHAYAARRKIEVARTGAASLQEFLQSLRQQVDVFPLAPQFLARAAQLVSKTNQFNTTSRRYTAQELTSLAGEGAHVAVIGIKDRFIESDHIGVIVLRDDRSNKCFAIDLFLLSCRVLGRGIETGVLAWAAIMAQKAGAAALEGTIVATERNAPVRNLYSEHGFSDLGNGRFRLDLSGPLPEPQFLELNNHFLDLQEA